MEHGNAVFGVVIPHLGTWIYNSISPNFAEPSLAFRYVTIILNVGYDATAPYSTDAKGVYSHIDNRDSSEYTDSTNMNTASIQAMYRLAMAFDSSEKTRWDRMLSDSGLSVSDYNYFGQSGFTSSTCSDSTQHLSGLSSDRAAVAIGNIAAQCVIEGRANDGFNQVFNGDTRNQFRDNTGYQSVNTVDNLVDLSRWQPLTWETSDSYTITQKYITPQWANTEPYTVGLDPRDYRTPDPVNSDYYSNLQGYEAQAEEVLDAVAALTQEQKMIAEYFDNKARETLFFPAVEALPRDDLKGLVATDACPPRFVPGQGFVPYAECLNTRDFWQLDFMLHIAQFDAGIVTWQEKTRHDAVRPITAIQYLYDGQNVNHYTGQVDGGDWTPYLVTSDHPEYPSATTCFCAAQAAAWELYHNRGSSNGPANLPPGTIHISGVAQPLAGVLLPGSSVHEPSNPPGPVPVSFATWDDYTTACAESRIYGGVHFRDAVDASLDLCDDVGVAAYHYFETLLSGDADLKRPAVALSPDPLRDPSNFPARSLVCR